MSWLYRMGLSCGSLTSSTDMNTFAREWIVCFSERSKCTKVCYVWFYEPAAGASNAIDESRTSKALWCP